MKRRIAFIDYFPPHYRVRLYEELARRMEADFYFFSDEGERWHNKVISAVWEGDYRRVDLWKTRIAGQALTPGIVPALSPKRYDAVIKNMNGKLMLPMTFGTAKARGIPFVLWSGMWHHPTTAVHRMTRGLTESIYRGADAIVGYGEHVKQFIADSPGVSPEKIFPAGQAVDSARFEAVEPIRDGGTATILFVGQFKEMKGLPYLLDAFESLPAGAARLQLVGNGPEEEEIRRRIAGRSDIEIIGHVSQDDLPAVLRSARCLVLPSVTTDLDREPWGLVVNEAMHTGLPVVVSDAVGAAAGGLVIDDANGLIVPERQAAPLARALSRLIEDPDLAARLGDRARQDARAFNYERMGAAFEGAVEYAIAACDPTDATR